MVDEVLILKAIRALKIDVPFLKAEVKKGIVTLHLYGGRVVTWTPEPVTSKVTTESELVTEAPADVDENVTKTSPAVEDIVRTFKGIPMPKVRKKVVTKQSGAGSKPDTKESKPK